MIGSNQVPPRSLKSDAIRYLGIAIIGLIIDLVIALSLRRIFALPLPVASAIGFLSAVAVNYVLFERFLFGQMRLSWIRLTKTYLSAQGALLVRVLVTWALTYVLYGSIMSDAVLLIISAGVSFVANFFIVRLLLR
jgi:putative flippase GtrA